MRNGFDATQKPGDHICRAVTQFMLRCRTQAIVCIPRHTNHRLAARRFDIMPNDDKLLRDRKWAMR